MRGALNPVPSQTPSLSWSLRGSPGQKSHGSPRESPSAFAWFWFVVLGQLSQALPRASPSALVCEGLATCGQLSVASGTPSPSKRGGAAGGGTFASHTPS